MKYYMYILYSQQINQYYVGQTEDLAARIIRHNTGRNPSTKKAKDWVFAYHEEFETRSEAVQRESEIKKKKSRKYIEQLILKQD